MADYIVKRGDSLWKIASNFGSRISGNTINAKIDTLVAVNGIKNRNLIYVGQGINFSGSGSASSPSAAPVQSNRKVSITGFGLQAGSTTGRDMYVCWSWSRENTKHYRVRWEWYVNGHLEWETSDVTVPYSNKNGINQEASYVQVFIIPVAENKLNSKGEDTGVPYWSDVEETGKQYQFSENPPLAPPTPSKPEINNEKLTLTASISNIKANELDAVGVKFNIVMDNSVSIYTSPSPVTINTTANYVSYQHAVKDGHTYTVRALSVGANGKESGWSDFSESAGTKPSAPTIIKDKCRRVKRTDGAISAYLEWSAVANATSYKIEYVTVETDFETTPGNIQEVTTENARTSLEMILNETGYDYFFRVRAINQDGESDPTEVVMIPIGTTPAAPTTWSTAESAFVGDTMELNWIHNPTDNSKQTYAQLSLNINDGGWNTVGTFVNTTDADTTGDRIDETAYTYGTAVSYKGNLYFKMDTSHADLVDAKIQWKVRTAGITDEFGDENWSVERTIYIYEKPSLNLSMTSDLAGTGALITTLTSFPFYIRAKDTLAVHDIQKPVGYHVQIISKDYYVTVDDAGRSKTINPGDAVYSKYFTTSDELIVEMSANNLDLESFMSYTLFCEEDMSTGLVISNQHEFTVDWVDMEYAIDADISIDTESYSALITPYCVEKVPAGPGGKNLIRYPYVDTNKTYNGITFTDIGDGTIEVTGTATDTSTFILCENLELSAESAYTLSGTPQGGSSTTYGIHFVGVTDGGSQWYIYNQSASQTRVPVENIHSGRLILTIYKNVTVNNLVFKPQLECGLVATDYEEYYEKYENGRLIENLTLAVYRREYDGTYTEVASGIPNAYTSVTDPHPALDYARYRFTAKDMSTGAISFYDMPGYPINGSAILLQWSEEWSTFDVGEKQSIESLPWSGSLLKLPYNIKVTDNRKTEVELVKYAGRRHPVSYYGTQVGETSQWNVDIPKDDKETIYALRRLSLWNGDVYVREPSGMGYWANVAVSFNQSYDDVKIPISLDITRVEGGV